MNKILDILSEIYNFNYLRLRPGSEREIAAYYNQRPGDHLKLDNETKRGSGHSSRIEMKISEQDQKYIGEALVHKTSTRALKGKSTKISFFEKVMPGLSPYLFSGEWDGKC